MCVVDIWARQTSAERTVLSAFRDPEVILELYLTWMLVSAPTWIKKYPIGA